MERAERVRVFRDFLEASNLDVAVIQDMHDVHWLSGFNTPGAPRGQALIVSQDRIFISSRKLEVTNAFIHSPLHLSSGHNEGDDPTQHLLQNVLKLKPSSVGWQLGNERTTPGDAGELFAGLAAAGVRVEDISGVVRAMRSPKSPSELALMRRAGEICALSMHAAIEETRRAGASENTIAGAAIAAARAAGGDYAAYPTFVCSGDKAALGHYAANQVCVPVRQHQNVFYELAGCFQRYHVGMMRTAHVAHSLPADMKRAEGCVVAALRAMRDAAVPGAMPYDVHEAAEAQLRPLLAHGWVISQRSGYSIGIGFATDWGECDEIMTRSIRNGEEKPLPLHATLHLIPWVRHPVYGAVGISDTVVVLPGGAASLEPASKPPEEIILIKPQTPHTQDALEVVATYGDTLGQPTPLRQLSGEEGGLDVGCQLLIKDESNRLGQLAFKPLGGGYACARLLMRRKGLAVGDPGAVFRELARKPQEEQLVFTSATDGNHGAGLAWAAQQLGHRAVIYLPQGAADSRVQRVRDLGGEAVVTDMSYDDTVAHAAASAQQNGWLLVQDTAWEGYTQVPSDIMAAYKLIAHEAVQQVAQLQQQGAAGAPTHVVLQVGVGSFAAAIVQYMREQLGRGVRVITLEPRGSNCLQTSLRHGVKTNLGGAPHTVMLGLDCCVVSDLAWPTLRNETFAAVSISDGVAADGVRSLRALGVRSGESGAASGVGMLRALSAEQRAALGITSDSVVLLFNTEGVTDPVTTERILGDSAETCGSDDVQIYFSPHELWA